MIVLYGADSSGCLYYTAVFGSNVRLIEPIHPSECELLVPEIAPVPTSRATTVSYWFNVDFIRYSHHHFRNYDPDFIRMFLSESQMLVVGPYPWLDVI